MKSDLARKKHGLNAHRLAYFCFSAVAALVTFLFAAPAPAPAQAEQKEPGPGRRLLVADYSTKRIALLAANGKSEWETKINDLHDLHVLPDGNILFQTTWTHLVEVDPRTD